MKDELIAQAADASTVIACCEKSLREFLPNGVFRYRRAALQLVSQVLSMLHKETGEHLLVRKSCFHSGQSGWLRLNPQFAALPFFDGILPTSIEAIDAQTGGKTALALSAFKNSPALARQLAWDALCDRSTASLSAYRVHMKRHNRSVSKHFKDRNNQIERLVSEEGAAELVRDLLLGLRARLDVAERDTIAAELALRDIASIQLLLVPGLRPECIVNLSQRDISLTDSTAEINIDPAKIKTFGSPSAADGISLRFDPKWRWPFAQYIRDYNVCREARVAKIEETLSAADRERFEAPYFFLTTAARPRRFLAGGDRLILAPLHFTSFISRIAVLMCSILGKNASALSSGCGRHLHAAVLDEQGRRAMIPLVLGNSERTAADPYGRVSESACFIEAHRKYTTLTEDIVTNFTKFETDSN